jgi:hypothetical protein
MQKKKEEHEDKKKIATENAARDKITKIKSRQNYIVKPINIYAVMIPR